MRLVGARGQKSRNAYFVERKKLREGRPDSDVATSGGRIKKIRGNTKAKRTNNKNNLKNVNGCPSNCTGRFPLWMQEESDDSFDRGIKCVP